MRAVLLATVVFALVAGCAAPTVSVFGLGRVQQEHLGDADYRLEYVGTRDNFHYLRLSSGQRQRTYRVSRGELAVDQAFPLGRQAVPVRWYTLDEYRDARRQVLAGQEWALVPAADHLTLRLRRSRGAQAY